MAQVCYAATYIEKDDDLLYRYLQCKYGKGPGMPQGIRAHSFVFANRNYVGSGDSMGVAMTDATFATFMSEENVRTTCTPKCADRAVSSLSTFRMCEAECKAGCCEGVPMCPAEPGDGTLDAAGERVYYVY